MLPLAMSAQDTIVAVSSPPGRSRRGLVRLSGPQAWTVVAKLILPNTAMPEPGVLTPVRLMSPALPALLVHFRGPRSFTGQDVAELQVVGNPALLDRLLRRAVSAGARLAEPGEFTFRGYAAGRFDLTQAEGIAATIAAASDAQLQAAALLREGKLGSLAHELVDAVGTQLALVEAGIDFTDQDDVVPIGPGELAANVAAVVAKLHDLLARSRSWGELEALPRVVLVGPPSVGKSTLFNALLGRQRAVISATPGTTRDVLAEPLTLENPHGQRVEVMLVDVAGLDQPAAALDEKVQEAARAAMRRADLILAVGDPAHEPGIVASPLPQNVAVLKVAAKADVARRDDDALAVSAVTGEGLDHLRQGIAQHVGSRGVSLSGEMLALQPRHELGLRSARAALAEVVELLEPQRDRTAIAQVEMVADGLRKALDELAGLGGELTPDDVLGRVFATFCIGK